MNDILYIVMPAYNEEDNIKEVVESWYSILSNKDENSKLIIADSGSTDTTHKILLDMKKQYPKLEVISDTNQFHGPKCIALYDYAIKHNADYIFQTDSDGQTNPAEFDNFWNMRGQYDAIFGNRIVRGDGKDRAFVEKVVCFLLRLYFGVKIPDANAPFRLMKADILKMYLYKLPSDYNLPNIMLTMYFVHYKKKVDFEVISFKPRIAGINSVNISRIIKIGIKALLDFMKLKQEM